MNYAAIPAKILAKIEPEKDGCLIWQGGTGGRPEYPYGVCRSGGKKVLVHRLVYRLVVGSIPDGWHVHHTCERTLCLNPLHLKPLPIKEHIGEWHRRKTHCPQGHPYDETNTYIRPDGARTCRACRRKS